MTENTSRIRKNEIGRWVCEDRELTSGDPLDVLIADHWIRGRIEHIHAWQPYSLVVASGPDFETLLMLHPGMPARLP